MKRVLILAAMALAVSVVSASARTPIARHHHAKATTVRLYDYAPAPVYQNSYLAMPLILGVAY